MPCAKEEEPKIKEDDVAIIFDFDTTLLAYVIEEQEEGCITLMFLEATY